MKNCRNNMLLSLLVSMMIMPFCVTFWLWSWPKDASWQEEACSIDKKTCKELSNDFTVPYCINSSVDYALDCGWPSVVNKLSSIQTTPAKSLGDFYMKDIVEKYCGALLWEENFGRIYFARPSDVSDSWDWEQTFDSRQSIFVYALCSSFKDENWMPFIDDSDYSKKFLSEVFKTEDIVWTLKLKQKSWWKDLCDLTDNPNIDDCDMSIYASEIYSAIMSDIFKIKYAQVLHVDTVEDFNPEDKVLEFMSGYFDYFKKEWNELNAEYPYIQTIRVLQSNQQYYKRVLGTLKIINNSDLADIALQNRCPKDTPKNTTIAWSDFVACAFHSSQAKWAAITPSFITLVYNEMMNYRVFQQYIKTWISERIKKMNSNTDKKDIRFSIVCRSSGRGY